MQIYHDTVIFVIILLSWKNLIVCELYILSLMCFYNHWDRADPKWKSIKTSRNQVSQFCFPFQKKIV